MKDEKYVCLAGSYNSKREDSIDGRKIQRYQWVFDKLRQERGETDTLNTLSKKGLFIRISGSSSIGQAHP